MDPSQPGTTDPLPDPSQPDTTDPLPTSASSYDDFKDAIDSGADCPELFEIANSIGKTNRMNDDLRKIGCFASTSERIDFETSTDDPYSPDQYRLGYMICAMDVEGVFEEAGTTDPTEAAGWYAEGLVGSASEGGRAGCLDALKGRESRYPESSD
jgi:hypothetical protein